MFILSYNLIFKGRPNLLHLGFKQLAQHMTHSRFSTNAESAQLKRKEQSVRANSITKHQIEREDFNQSDTSVLYRKHLESSKSNILQHWYSSAAEGITPALNIFFKPQVSLTTVSGSLSLSVFRTIPKMLQQQVSHSQTNSATTAHSCTPSPQLTPTPEPQGTFAEINTLRNSAGTSFQRIQRGN